MRKLKLTTIALTLLISAVMLSAQQIHTGTYDIDRMASMIRDALDLSYSQTIHIQDILTEIHGQIELTKPDNLTNPEIVNEDADNFRLAADEKIKSVLNDEQKLKYNQVKNSIFRTVLKYERPNQM
jgi:Spy/CpxP family protein refolding chaperone